MPATNQVHRSDCSCPNRTPAEGVPAVPKPAHYRGSYHVDSAHVRAMAYANPETLCWRCGRTLAQIRQVKPRARWTAGHLIDSLPGGPLAPECSPCNYAAGGKLRHHTRTDLTW